MLLKSLVVISLHCVVNFVGGLRIPEKVYITTQAPIESEIQTDLVAPSPTSISQYHQHHPQHQQPSDHSFIFAPFHAHLLPFNVESLYQSEDSEESTEEIDDGNTYKVYRPLPHENPQFVDMLPPPLAQNEPNYYDAKPRKFKKYSKAHEDIKAKKSQLKQQQQQNEIVRKERELEDEREEVAESQNQESEDHFVEQSLPTSRLDFAMHGHKGADTYKFGYDTGKGQFQIEEKDENGDVYGKYGYQDDEGKFRVVKYSSKKDEGFKVL